MWMQVGVEEGWTPLGANCLPRKMKDYSFLAKKKNKKNTPPPKHTQNYLKIDVASSDTIASLCQLPRDKV